MKLKIIFLFVFSIISLFLTFSCSKSDSIKIGFLGTLTGRQSDVGVGARNGVLLGIEELNAKGGINGKKIDLLIRDDQGNAEEAKKAVKELVNAGVVTIIGPVLSGMTIAALPVANENKMLLLSPTSVSNVFNKKDDYLIRISPATQSAVAAFAYYVAHKLNIKKLSFVYDLSNKGYSEDWYNNFKASFEKNKGKTSDPVQFFGKEKNDFHEISQKLLKDSPEAVVIIASALDTAFICQQIRKINLKIPIFIAGWAMTDDLITNGGKAVEGVIISYNFNKNSMIKEYVGFKNKYKERFGNQPDFPAKYGYESVEVLGIALSRLKNITPEEVKKEIIRQGQFKGLQGVFNIDFFGDAESTLFFFTIKNGSFVIIE